MKKIVLVLIGVLIFCGFWQGGDKPYKGASNAIVTDDGVINTGSGVVYGVYIITHECNGGGEFDLYDGSDTTGTKIYDSIILATDCQIVFAPPVPISYDASLYGDMTITGTSVSINVIYE